MKLVSRILSIFGLLSLLAGQASAQSAVVPPLLNFQGRLTRPDGVPVANGNYSIQFSLWDAASNGSEKWNQTVSTVSVKNGIFAVLLFGFPATTFDGNLWLEIKVGTDAPLSPRQQLVSVAYAMKANTVPDGSITTNKLSTDFKTAGGDLTGLFPNPLLATNPGSLLKVSGGALTSNGTNLSAVGKLSLMQNGQTGEIMRIGNGIPLGITNEANYDIPILNFDLNSRQPDRNDARAGAMIRLDARGDSTESSIIQFITRQAGSANETFAMGITRSGKIGIRGGEPQAELDVNGRVYVRDGVIQRGGNPITSTSDLGLYSQVSGNTVRFVSNNGNFAWYSDAWYSGRGENQIMTLSPLGRLGIIRDNPRAELDVNGTALFRGPLGIGVGNPQKTLDVNGDAQINGIISATEVQVTGSDVAEPYHILPAGHVEPASGIVVSIKRGSAGKLQVSSSAYDRTVAGIISGANGVKPGLILRQPGTMADGNLPVASSGRVYCWCDANANGAILEGDLLTTSNTPGHAMKATDRQRRDGAIIGKAMSTLKKGRGLVLVLVTLQ